jgi:hypothetical protein
VPTRPVPSPVELKLIDIDDNTFEGYSNVLKTGEESDPLGIKFLFFMVLHVRPETQLSRI